MPVSQIHPHGLCLPEQVHLTEDQSGQLRLYVQGQVLELLDFVGIALGHLAPQEVVVARHHHLQETNNEIR